VSPLEGLEAAGFTVTHATGVKAHTRIPPATAEMLPGGVHVRFLGAGDEELAAEHRHGAAFTWLGSLPAGTAAIELRATLSTGAGEHVVGVTGVGRHRLALGGEELFDERVALTGDDLGEAVLRPPQHGVPVTLEGETELVLRSELDPGAFMAAVHLNVEPPSGDEEAELERAVELAREADVAVVVVGTNEEVECEGVDRDDLALPGRQDELVARVAAANPRTVVVVNAGAPVLLPWADEVAAILLAWFPGQEFGNALADVLTGVSEPGGRLPTTWPRTEEDLPSTQPQDGVLTYDEGIFVGYRAYERDGREPLFPFGHGLGYTTWEYLSVELRDGLVFVRVRNSGERRGREVVQVYASKPGSAIERPPRWLAGYAIAEAEPGEEVEVEVTIDPRAFQHWDGGWRTEPGDFDLEATSRS
jgi:beta-glucosidase